MKTTNLWGKYGIFSPLTSVWPDWAIYCTLGNFSKPVATIILPKLPTFLGNFCNGVKIFHFSSGIIFVQLLLTFGDFYTGHTACHGHYQRDHNVSMLNYNLNYNTIPIDCVDDGILMIDFTRSLFLANELIILSRVVRMLLCYLHGATYIVERKANLLLRDTKSWAILWDRVILFFCQTAELFVENGKYFKAVTPSI